MAEEGQSKSILKRITIMILAEDHRKLKIMYPRGGYNRIIRKLVNDHVRERMRKLTEDLDGEDTIRPVLNGPQDHDEGGSTGGGPAAA